MNWGYLYTPIQTGTFECGYTPAYWEYTKYECDYTPITWGYPNIPSIGDMLLNAFIWHFRSHGGNAQMGTSPVGSVSTFPLAESDVCPRFTRFTNAHTHTHLTPHTPTTSILHADSLDINQAFSNGGPWAKSPGQIWPTDHSCLALCQFQNAQKHIEQRCVHLALRCLSLNCLWPIMACHQKQLRTPDIKQTSNQPCVCKIMAAM